MVAASFLSLSFTLFLPPSSQPPPSQRRPHPPELVSSTQRCHIRKLVNQKQVLAATGRKDGGGVRQGGVITGCSEMEGCRRGAERRKRRRLQAAIKVFKVFQHVKAQRSANSPFKRASEIKPSANQSARLALKRALMPLKSKLSREAIHRDASGTASVAASAGAGLRYASRANYKGT